jgi:hypothetical protein
VRTPLDKLTPGDVVVMDDDNYAFYTGPGKHGDDASNPVLRLLTATGHKSTDYVVPDEPLFGSKGVLAVKNLMGNVDAANMLPLLFLLRDGEEADDSNIGKLLALSALSSQLSALSSRLSARSAARAG